MAKTASERSRPQGSHCVALDLGISSVRVVEVEFDHSDPFALRVLRRGSAPLPPRLWEDLGSHRDALLQAIQRALSTASITTKSVVACMPRRLVTLRTIKLPSAPEEEMRAMISFEAQQYILYPLEEVILGFHPLNNSALGEGGDLSTVLLAAVRKGLVADLMTVFDRAGLQLRQLSVSSLALAEHIRDSMDPAAVIEVDAGEIDMAVVANQQLLFTRAVGLESSSDIGVSQQRLLEEVVRSFTALQNEFRLRIPSQVFVITSEGTADGLDRAIAETLEIPASGLVSRALPASAPELRAYAGAIGMALQSRAGSIAPINLVPTDRAERRAQKANQQRQFVAVVLVTALMLAGIVYLSAYARQRSLQQKLTEDANQRLEAVNQQLTRRETDFKTSSDLVNQLQKGLDRDHPTVDILVAINRALPKSQNIWLTQLSFSRGGSLTLRGNTKSSLAATDLAVALQKSPTFRRVRLNYIGDAQDTEATAEVNLNSGQSDTGALQPLPGLAKTSTVAPVGVSPPASTPGPPGSPGPAPGNPGPVPSLSAPPGGVQRGTKRNTGIGLNPAPTPRPVPGAAKLPLTSFVIVCEINPRSKRLPPDPVETVVAAAATQRAPTTTGISGKTDKARVPTRMASTEKPEKVPVKLTAKENTHAEH